MKGTGGSRTESYQMEVMLMGRNGSPQYGDLCSWGETYANSGVRVTVATGEVMSLLA